MPRWVAPSIAADMWKISTSEIMERIRRGELQWRQEGAFMFVNIGQRQDAAAADQRATYSLVTPEERAALLETPDIARMRLLSSANRRRPMAA